MPDVEVTAAAPLAPVTGFPAYGSMIQVRSSLGPPEVYIPIAGQGDLTGPGTQVGTVETTSHTTGAPIRTYVPGLIELGDFSFPCFWNPQDPTQRSDSPYGLSYLLNNRIITKFQLILADPSHYTRQFWAFVKQLNETAPTQGILTRQVALHITSVLTEVSPAIFLTPASATATAAGNPSGTFQVSAGGSAAPWQAIASDPWITITSPTGPQTGDQPVNYSVAANAGGTARTGFISISAFNLQFGISQAATA